MAIKGRESGTEQERWKSMVARGMRAQLQTGNLLTGQLLVSLDFHPDAPPAEIVLSGPVPELAKAKASTDASDDQPSD